MKPKNFPERKNMRRLAAIDRFQNPPRGKTVREDDIETTKRNLISDARSIRTKKARK